MGSIIQSVGTYTPSRVLTNKDLEKILALSGQETSNDWIVKRVGIHRRRVASSSETVGSMAVQASLDAIAGLKRDIPPIDHIFIATNTSTHPYPNEAGYVVADLHKLHPSLVKKSAGGTDPYGGCGAINMAFMYADCLVRSGVRNSVLVVGSEKLTAHTDYSDRNTCVLFGDGASAYIISGVNEDAGFIGHSDESSGDRRELIYCRDQDKVTLESALESLVDGKTPKKSFGKALHMDGTKVYKYVVRAWDELIAGFRGNKQLNPGELDFNLIKWIAGHLFNLSGFQELDSRHPGFLAKCGLDDREEVENYFFNTSNASQGRRAKRVLGLASPGDYLLMHGYGAGLQRCANLYRQPLTLVA